MPELNELYQQVILDHAQKPRNFGRMEHANHTAEGNNPLCGDEIRIYLELADGIMKDICFEGCGCAISMASASLMIEMLKGKSRAEFLELFEMFHELITQGSLSLSLHHSKTLGKFAVFSGISEFPVRVKCASLAWHTLKNALQTESKIG